MLLLSSTNKRAKRKNTKSKIVSEEGDRRSQDDSLISYPLG